MSFCNLTHLEAHVTPPQRAGSNINGQGLLILGGNDARTEDLSNRGLLCQSTPGVHPTTEETLPIKQQHLLPLAIQPCSNKSHLEMALTFQHSHSPPSSDSDVDVSNTSGQRCLTPDDSESYSEEQSLDNSTSATKSKRSRTQQQPLKPPPGSGPRAQSGTWKCAVHNTLATSTNSPTSAIPTTNTRSSDAVAPISPTSRLPSGTKYKQVERYINKDGKVGVVICPNYGGGWSTFFHRGLEEARQTNDKLAVAAIKHTIEVMMFDKEAISALLEGNRHKVVDIVRTRAGNQICRMKKLWPLEIRWVDPAEEVFVHEYDGKETLCMKRDLILWNA